MRAPYRIPAAIIRSTIGSSQWWPFLLRGTEPGSFVWLTRHWPELEMFVDHEVCAASARSAVAPGAIAVPAAD